MDTGGGTAGNGAIGGGAGMSRVAALLAANTFAGALSPLRRSCDTGGGGASGRPGAGDTIEGGRAGDGCATGGGGAMPCASQEGMLPRDFSRSTTSVSSGSSGIRAGRGGGGFGTAAGDEATDEALNGRGAFATPGR
jgi:hypothetical protein